MFHPLWCQKGHTAKELLANWKDASFGAVISLPKAMREKARFVLGAMELRMAALGFGWADVTATQVYTIFDIHLLLASEFVRRGAIPGGLTWHFARPPVQGLDFEVDVLGVARELVI